MPDNPNSPSDGQKRPVVSPSTASLPERLVLQHALAGLLHDIVTFHEKDDASVNEVSTMYEAVLFVGWRAFELGKVPFMEALLNEAATGPHRDEMLDTGIRAWFNQHHLAKKKHPWGKSKLSTKK
jgi:hypothetical protein